MANNEVNFELVPDNWADDGDFGLSGHATTVVRRRAQDMDIVEKFIKPNGQFAGAPQTWLRKQKNSRRIANEIRERANPHYHVPKTFISHGKVREEFVDGVMADKYTGDMRDLLPGVAHFINDMSELYPVKVQKNNRVPGIALKDVSELDNALADLRRFGVVSENNLKLIRDVYVFLRDMPENQAWVFGHNDLQPSNVLVNPKDGRLSFIDFEFAEYMPMFYTMYGGFTSKPVLWDYVNKLPRATNPGLRWNYDARVAELYKFLFRVESKMRDATHSFDTDLAARTAARINDMGMMRIRKLLGALKVTEKIKELDGANSLVPITHFGRE